MAVQTSLVLDTPAASPDTALRHFGARLALETDPSDVYADMAAGVPGFAVVDVRSRADFRAAHVPGALSLPHREISAAALESLGLSAEDVVVVYCWGPHCNGAVRGAVRLAALGYRVKEMIGGIDGWRRDGLPVKGSGAA